MTEFEDNDETTGTETKTRLLQSITYDGMMRSVKSLGDLTINALP
jgi:hypothetical protein